MINILCYIIIIYILFQSYLDNCNETNNDNFQLNTTKISVKDTKNSKTNKADNQKIIIYDKPNPWTKLATTNNSLYPYNYYIKINIPSLNDYENWKNIIPNLQFNSKSGELIIPSEDEPTALAIANLIIINFLGQISLDQILEKHLIEISINKCKLYPVVQNKIREQINENIYAKSKVIDNLSFKKDLYKDNKNSLQNDNMIINNDDILAYDNNNYAYVNI